METLERDNATLQKSLEEQQLKKEAGGGGKRVMAGGGFSTPNASPFASKRAASVDQGETPTGHALAAAPTENSVLLLGKVSTWFFKFILYFYCLPCHTSARLID